MIRKIINRVTNRVNEWIEDGLRGLLGRLTPDRRVILVVTMLVIFSALSIYMTVSSIYNIGKNNSERMHIEQIKTLKLQLEQQKDSINNQNNHYEYERRSE